MMSFLTASLLRVIALVAPSRALMWSPSTGAIFDDFHSIWLVLTPAFGVGLATTQRIILPPALLAEVS